MAGLGGLEGASSGAPTSGTRLSVLAFELPQSITPTIAGLTVGAFVGVFGFIAVLLLVGRGNRRPMPRRASVGADQVVFIPPYTPMQRDTPMPPQAFSIPPSSSHQPAAAPYARVQARPGHHHANALAFVPSTSLSARAFAKMGYEVDPDDERDAPDADPFVSIEVDMLDEDDLIESNTPVPHVASQAAVTISPVVVLSSTTPVNGIRSAPKSSPHPLGVIKSSSVAMRAAPIAELTFDDAPTEIGETYFDEPPQPRRRTDPPKIRPKAVTGPRFPDYQAQALPNVTPPPMRAVPSRNG